MAHRPQNERKPWFPTLEHRLIGNSVLDPLTECWEWIGFRDRKGYGMTTLWVNGKRRSLYAHRLSLETLRGVVVPSGMHVDHMCMNPSCINPAHLQLCSPSVNSQLKYSRKR